MSTQRKSLALAIFAAGALAGCVATALLSPQFLSAAPKNLSGQKFEALDARLLALEGLTSGLSVNEEGALVFSGPVLFKNSSGDETLLVNDEGDQYPDLVAPPVQVIGTATPWINEPMPALAVRGEAKIVSTAREGGLPALGISVEPDPAAPPEAEFPPGLVVIGTTTDWFWRAAEFVGDFNVIGKTHMVADEGPILEAAYSANWQTNLPSPPPALRVIGPTELTAHPTNPGALDVIGKTHMVAEDSPILTVAGPVPWAGEPDPTRTALSVIGPTKLRPYEDDPDSKALSVVGKTETGDTFVELLITPRVELEDVEGIEGRFQRLEVVKEFIPPLP